jgi:glucokinase-like ROK family protein
VQSDPGFCYSFSKIAACILIKILYTLISLLPQSINKVLMSKSQTADQDMVRRVNKSLVLNTLRLHAPISRAEVADRTGLNRSTVTHIVNALIEAGLVSEQPFDRNTVGRPSIALTLRPEGGAVIGVEIGVDFISVLLTNFISQPLWRVWIDTDPACSQSDILAKTEEAIDQAILISRDRQLRMIGIGVGIPGLVDMQKGELIFAPNLRWRNLPLGNRWAKRFNLPVYVENEANLAALGEYYFGIARNVENFIYLSSGIGLGGGILVSGHLFRGGHGFAGEIGHMQRDPNGELCACGRIGCWETQVGPRAVLQRIKKVLQDSPALPRPDGVTEDLKGLTFRKVVNAALNGDPLCLHSIEEAAYHLAVGIADLVNIFNPELVVIGGALSQAQPILQAVIEKTVFSNTLSPSVDQLKIEFSERGKDACVYGAIAIVLDDILRELAIV